MWPPSSYGETLALIGILSAALVAARGIYRWGRGLARRWSILETIITRELSHNSGSSLKDDVTNTVAALHSTNLRIDTLDNRFHTLAEANNLIWPAIEAVAKASPPPEEEEPRHVLP